MDARRPRIQLPQDHATDGRINAVVAVTHHYGSAQSDSLLDRFGIGYLI